MQPNLASLIVVIALTRLSLAQTSMLPVQGTPSATVPAIDRIGPGTLMLAELSKSLDAKKCKPGDKVEAKLTVDLLAHGQIVIPRNVKIIGHVTDAKSQTKESPNSMVGIVFDRVIMKDGRELSMQATIHALGRPLTLAPDDPMSPGRTNPSPGSQPPGTMGTAAGPVSVQITPNNFPVSVGPKTTAPIRISASPLTEQSQGVIELTEISLSKSKEVSVISSTSQNVHLDGGTQLLLRTE